MTTRTPTYEIVDYKQKFRNNDIIFFNRITYLVNLNHIEIYNPSNDFVFLCFYLTLGDSIETIKLDKNIIDAFLGKDCCEYNEDRTKLKIEIPWKKLGYWNKISPLSVIYHEMSIRINYEGSAHEIYCIGKNAVTMDRNIEKHEYIPNFHQQSICIYENGKHVFSFDNVYGLIHGLFVTSNFVKMMDYVKLFTVYKPSNEINEIEKLYDYSSKTLKQILLNNKLTENMYYLPLNKSKDINNPEFESSIQINDNENSRPLQIVIETESTREYKNPLTFEFFIYKTFQFKSFMGSPCIEYDIL